MRFRPASLGPTIYWVFLTLFWVALTADSVHRDLVRHRTGQLHFHEFTLLFFVAILFIHVYLYLFSCIELEPATLFLRRGLGGGTRIPYNNIVAVRPVQTANGRPIPNQVEIETARLSRDIYPHNYHRIAVADPRALAASLREKAPQAEYELA